MNLHISHYFAREAHGIYHHAISPEDICSYLSLSNNSCWSNLLKKKKIIKERMKYWIFEIFYSGKSLNDCVQCSATDAASNSAHSLYHSLPWYWCCWQRHSSKDRGGGSPALSSISNTDVFPMKHRMFGLEVNSEPTQP